MRPEYIYLECPLPTVVALLNVPDMLTLRNIDSIPSRSLQVSSFCWIRQSLAGTTYIVDMPSQGIPMRSVISELGWKQMLFIFDRYI